MKKAIIILTAFFAFTCLSCNKTSSKPTSSSSINRNLLPGWWISNVAKNGLNEYKRRYFGTDSTMLIDESNFGLGTATGKWWWLKGDTFYATGLGSSRGIVLVLTSDSLTINWIDASRILYYYK